MSDAEPSEPSAPVAALATANEVERRPGELTVEELAEVRAATNRESAGVMLAMVVSLFGSIVVAVAQPQLALGALAFGLVSMTGSVVAAHVLYADAARRYRLSTRGLDDIHRAFTTVSGDGGAATKDAEERARSLITSSRVPGSRAGR